MRHPRSIPIYVVIFDMVQIWPNSANFGPPLRAVRQVILCDLSDIDEVYRNIVNPMYDAHEQIQVEIVLREPPNPFKDWPTAAVEWGKLDDAAAEAKQEELRRRFAINKEKPGALPGD